MLSHKTYHGLYLSLLKQKTTSLLFSMLSNEKYKSFSLCARYTYFHTFYDFFPVSISSEISLLFSQLVSFDFFFVIHMNTL